ncbi:MAG: transposase [Saccharothrix sp.]|nr:transposase [Saccharothrix sp.]
METGGEDLVVAEHHPDQVGLVQDAAVEDEHHTLRPGVLRADAVAESFFATFKTEIGTNVWDTREDAGRDVFAYLGYYNHDRLHSTLGYRTAHEARVGYRQGLALVA